MAFLKGASNETVGVNSQLTTGILAQEKVQEDSSLQEDQTTTGQDTVELSQESKEAYANYAILSSTLKGKDKEDFVKITESLDQETAAKFVNLTASLTEKNQTDFINLIASLKDKPKKNLINTFSDLSPESRDKFLDVATSINEKKTLPKVIDITSKLTPEARDKFINIMIDLPESHTRNRAD